MEDLPVTGQFITRHHFRYLILVLGTFCISSVFSNVVTMSFTLVCMDPNRYNKTELEDVSFKTECWVATLLFSSHFRCTTIRINKKQKYSGQFQPPQCWQRFRSVMLVHDGAQSTFFLQVELFRQL